MHISPQWLRLLSVLRRMVVMLLLIHCLLLLPLFVGTMFGHCVVIQYFAIVAFQFRNHLGVEDRAGCFNSTVFLMSCDSQWYVALPNGAVG